jgi:hypothetical protein
MAAFASSAPSIYVVTPCLNAVETIDRTLQSVLTQAGNFHLQYHIQDGGSTDGTWERILWWQQHVESSNFPTSCKSITLTARQEADDGLYDAVAKGFGRMFSMFFPADSFMGWINADDILFQGALAYVSEFDRQFTREQVSWVAGSTAIIKDDGLISFYDRQLPDIALSGGLCDGLHWDFLQQEGVFFRGWLWRSACTQQLLSGLRLAGDWNLWRHFAQKNPLVQSNYPLAAFRLREGQLSGKQRNAYLSEIDAKLPLQERRERMQRIFDEGAPFRRVARGKYPNTQIFIYRENLTAIAEARYTKFFGKPTIEIPSEKTRQIFCGTEQPEANNDSSLGPEVLKRQHITARGLSAFDYRWQYPAITEQHAYSQLKALWRPTTDTTCFVAFPWATLIDHLQCGTQEAADWLRLVPRFASKLPAATRRVTVCQHILLRPHTQLLRDCGITDVFWPHATKQDLATGDLEGIRIHPFPLYPVQAVTESPKRLDRNVLFSFIGAQADRHYISDVRTLIFRHLESHPRGFIRKRAAWHFKADVYDKQIFASGQAQQEAQGVSAEALEFREAMSRSIFSLCPSGTGPNSIRLWESLGAGAIPVIMADTLALPGDPALWQEAAVFCPENEEAIRELPERLAGMAEDNDLLERKRLAMRQLWLKYGPECFVYDTLKLLMDEEGKFAGRAIAPAEAPPDEDVPALVGVARQIASGQTDLQSAGSILWRGLSTRAQLSSDDLQTTARRYPELLVAARMTKKLLAPETSGQLSWRVLEVLPDLR